MKLNSSESQSGDSREHMQAGQHDLQEMPSCSMCHLLSSIQVIVETGTLRLDEEDRHRSSTCACNLLVLLHQ